MNPTLAEIQRYLDQALGPMPEAQAFMVKHYAEKCNCRFAGVARAPGRTDYRPAFHAHNPAPDRPGIWVISPGGYADDATAAGATAYPHLPVT